MWKCPYCNAIIDYLNYSVNTCGSESGSVSLARIHSLSTPTATTDEYECEDSESGDWDGSPQYECSHCSADISPSELIYTPEEGKEEEEEEEEEKEPEETLHKIITPTNNIIKNTESKTLQCCLICKHCSHIFVSNINKYYIDNSDEIYNCPKCSTPNSPKEFNELLKKGYFNKPKKHVKQKIKHRLIPTTKKPRK